MKLVEEERNTRAKIERKREASKRERKYKNVKWRASELG